MFFLCLSPKNKTIFFLQIWREYDTDNSGYIEADELKNFLRDLLKEAKKINDVSEDKLIEYTDTMVSLTREQHLPIEIHKPLTNNCIICCPCWLLVGRWCLVLVHGWSHLSSGNLHNNNSSSNHITYKCTFVPKMLINRAVSTFRNDELTMHKLYDYFGPFCT